MPGESEEYLGPVQGYVCPECERGDGIVKVSLKHSYDEWDLIGVYSFGLFGLVGSLLGRKTTRLKCGHCGCDFPTRFSYFTGVLLLVVIAGCVVGGAGMILWRML